MYTDMIQAHHETRVLHTFTPLPEIIPIDILMFRFNKDPPIQYMAQLNTFKQEMTQTMSRQEQSSKISRRSV
jgi:hypothetical protein